MKKILGMLLVLALAFSAQAAAPARPVHDRTSAHAVSRTAQVRQKLIQLQLSDKHVEILEEKAEGATEVVCTGIVVKQGRGQDGKPASVLIANFSGADGLAFAVPLAQDEADKYTVLTHYFVRLK